MEKLNEKAFQKRKKKIRMKKLISTHAIVIALLDLLIFYNPPILFEKFI